MTIKNGCKKQGLWDQPAGLALSNSFKTVQNTAGMDKGILPAYTGINKYTTIQTACRNNYILDW